jgi:ribosomal protein S18 acetylase RimI-like enzyme
VSAATTIRVANLHSAVDADAIVRLLDEYAGDAMGRGSPLELAVRQRLVADLSAHPSALVYLAELQQRVVGLAVCFLQYSTFGAFDLLNIHDFIVTGSARGHGVGRAMLRAVCEAASARGCRKVTLEVREDNSVAQNLYESEGFTDCEPRMLFWQRALS